jgi:hypothetical protein
MNINFVNNNGTQKDVATLGFAVKSSKYASLYGKFFTRCLVDAKQITDTEEYRMPSQRKPGCSVD